MGPVSSHYEKMKPTQKFQKLHILEGGSNSESIPINPNVKMPEKNMITAWYKKLFWSL